MHNILTVDVEEWYHPEAIQHLYRQENWGQNENRVEKNVNLLLQLFDKNHAKATFFILGWLAEKHPQMIKKIVNAGHEIGSHGYSHKMITKMDKQEFSEDFAKSIHAIEKVAGKKIKGFRAPTFSIVDDTLWALDIMAEHGLKYDSSVYPIIHDRYGIPNAPRTMYYPLHNRTDFVEYPASTLNIFGYHFPFGGGGYLRIFPLWLTIYAIKKLNREGIPAMIYVHPWEFDIDQPNLNLHGLKKWRHYYNIKSNLVKLEKLLTAFQWTNFEHLLSENK